MISEGMGHESPAIGGRPDSVNESLGVQLGVLYLTSAGFVFSFGFDMLERKPRCFRVCWSDPVCHNIWQPSFTNSAGWIEMPFYALPQKIKEPTGGQLVLTYSDKIVVFNYVGSPLVWSYTPYTLEQARREGIR